MVYYGVDYGVYYGVDYVVYYGVDYVVYYGVDYGVYYGVDSRVMMVVFVKKDIIRANLNVEDGEHFEEYFNDFTMDIQITGTKSS